MSSKHRMKIFIDSTAFLGMHSENDNMRRESVNFFVEHFDSTIYMSLEQVGYCDDVIWQFPRSLQDQYYPFMDRLHTEMDIRRIPYSFKDLYRAMHNEELKTLAAPQALIAAQVLNYNAVLYTHDTDLQSVAAMNGRIGLFNNDNDKDFQITLNSFYKESTVITIDYGRIDYAG